MAAKSQQFWGQNVNVVIILTGEKRKKITSAYSHFCWYQTYVVNFRLECYSHYALYYLSESVIYPCSSGQRIMHSLFSSPYCFHI